MVRLKKEWEDNFVIDYWKCDDCHESYVDSNNDHCPYCGSANTWEDAMTVADIKDKETKVNGTLLYVVD